MPAFGPVTLTTRADAAMARVLRMTNMSVATSAGLHIDRVEDVALATNEAFASILNDGPADGLTCIVESDPGTILVRMVPNRPETPTAPHDKQRDPLTARILEAIADELSYEETAGSVEFRISNP